MEIKTKVKIGLGITAVMAAEVIKKSMRARIERRIYQQLHQTFDKQTIHGTWLRPEYQLLTHNYYLGGINILKNQTIIEYQFTANQRGQIIDLYRTNTHRVNPF